MRSDLPQPFAPAVLRLASDVRRLGRDPHEKNDAGELVWVRVRHGVLAQAATWRKLTVEQRHAAFVHATTLRMKAPPMALCHTSAAALWGLPRVSAWPKSVDIISPARSSGVIFRHDLPMGRTVEVAGLRVTSVARTVIDLGRTENLHDAVAAADHALHHELCTRAALEEEFDRLDPGVPGRAMARLAIDLADGRSMSAGESLSRVQMFRLNLPRPELQVEVRDADEFIAFCDFGWEDVMGEFDGRKKYKVPAEASPEQVAEVLWREKRREDRIRSTDRRMARWVWGDAIRPAQMLRILAAQGIRQSAVNSWFADEVAAKHPRRPDAG